MVDDEVAPIDMGSGGGDPSKVWTNASADPRSPGPGMEAAQAPPQAAGVQVVPRQKGEALVAPLPRAQQVRQLRTAAKPQTAEDKALSAFVQSLGVDPEEVGLEPDEAPAPAMVEAAKLHKEMTAPAATAGTLMERATKRALKALNGLPVGVELTISGDSLGPDGVEFVMGLGFLLGQGVATCRDGIHYTMKRSA